jgi:hypothetical protein
MKARNARSQTAMSATREVRLRLNSTMELESPIKSPF